MTEPDGLEIARRIHARDVSLWSTDTEAQSAIGQRLGWLDAPAWLKSNQGMLRDWAETIHTRGFERVVLLGMGGSSLAAEVLARIFGASGSGLPVVVLDDTHPDAVLAVVRSGDLATTLFLASSKSGSTAEVSALLAYFWRALENDGRRAGVNFAAVTDDGSALAQLACDRKFDQCFLNPVDIGGRYSALSAFGMVPAALLGVDLERLLASADAALNSSDPQSSSADHSALALGQMMGRAALAGRDKLTVLLSSRLAPFASWIEQLVAESTGKSGMGIVPITGEALPIEAYGDDRMFAVVILEGDCALQARSEAIEAAGHPLVRHKLKDIYDIGGAFFHWQFAVAVAGAVLGVNPFDEPDVSRSKATTIRLLNDPKMRDNSELVSVAKDQGVVLRGLAASAPAGPSIRAQLALFFRAVKPGDYLCVLPYLYIDEHLQRSLFDLIEVLRPALNVPVTLNPGPRYLHSTGQLHKGGANSGVFLIFCAQTVGDLEIPGEPYTFGDLNRAQAEGDFVTLAEAGRRVLQVDLGESPRAAIETLADTAAQVLAP